MGSRYSLDGDGPDNGVRAFARWCNWKHARLWSERVQVRTLREQQVDVGKWLSRLIWDQEFGSSNLSIRTLQKPRPG